MPTSNKFPHRCSKCGRRNALRQPIEAYYRVPKCVCGSQQWYLDKTRQARRDRPIPCRCDGYMFPHRPGSPHCQKSQNYIPPEVAAAIGRGDFNLLKEGY